MKKVHNIILESLLSKEEMENVYGLEKECSNDRALERFLCQKSCIFFLDWADSCEDFDRFYSFVQTRLKALAGLDFELIDKRIHLSSLKERAKEKGDFVPLLIQLFNQQLESFGFACALIPSNDDTYRICITKLSSSNILSQIEFMEGRIQLCCSLRW
jgi:hypothetical protein